MSNSALATVSLTTHLLTKLGQPECNLEIGIIVVRLWIGASIVTLHWCWVEIKVKSK